MTINTGDRGLGDPAARPLTRPAGSTATSAQALTAGLATLPGSEDTLFRDPFSDFAPSGR